MLQIYCDRWKLQVNISKTKAMIFKKGGRNRGNLSFTYTHQKLEIGKCFKYFGVIFNNGWLIQCKLIIGYMAKL